MGKMGWHNKSDVDKQNEIKQLQDYLRETDFYYLRKMETGEAVRPDIVSKRVQARNRLRELGL